MRRRIVRLGAYLALPAVVMLAGCLDFESGTASNGVDMPSYGVPGGELPVTLYAYLPGTADNVQGYVYVRMRNNWTVKNNVWNYISESRLLDSQFVYSAAKSTDAENAGTHWGSDGNHFWWGGSSGTFDVTAAENVTITGTLIVSSTQAPGTYTVDYGLGDNQEDPTPPDSEGESFGHTVQVGDLKIALGAKAPPDQTTIAATQQNVEVTQLEVEAGVRAASYTITALSFTHQGTGSMANVSRARLFRDNNSDGRLQLGGDTLLATINNPTATMNFASFSSVVSGGLKGNFLVIYDFAGATLGNTFISRIVPAGVTAGGTTVVGPTVDSNTITISNSPSLNAALGDNSPSATYQVVSANSQDKTLIQLAFSAGAVGDVELTDLTLTCRYVGPAANELEAGDVTDIRLYRDNDGDGVLDAATDPQVGQTITWGPWWPGHHVYVQSGRQPQSGHLCQLHGQLHRGH